MKPMLAVEAPAKLVFPLYASPKLDGVRCVVSEGIALTRNLTPITNAFVQDTIGSTYLHGLDGELIVGEPYAHDVYLKTSGAVRKAVGEPDFTFYVFDYWTETQTPFSRRHELMMRHAERLEAHPRVKLLPQRLIHHNDALLQYESELLALGYEGVMLRRADSLYKYGRSTVREGYLLKLKRFSDGEAVIIGFEELMHNANEAGLDELGYTKRSTCQENLVPMGTLGALVVRDCKTGVEFKIGTGYTQSRRQAMWEQRAQLMGQIVKYKHFEKGVKEAPRFPVWLGFRDSSDM